MGDYILNAFQQYMNNIQNINDRNILIVTKGWEKKYLNQIKEKEEKAKGEIA